MICSAHMLSNFFKVMRFKLISTALIISELCFQFCTLNYFCKLVIFCCKSFIWFLQFIEFIILFLKLLILSIYDNINHCIIWLLQLFYFTLKLVYFFLSINTWAMWIERKPYLTFNAWHISWIISLWSPLTKSRSQLLSTIAILLSAKSV